jgi:hypothetical protein
VKVSDLSLSVNLGDNLSVIGIESLQLKSNIIFDIFEGFYTFKKQHFKMTLFVKTRIEHALIMLCFENDQ